MKTIKKPTTKVSKVTSRKTPKRIKIGYLDFKLVPRSKKWSIKHKAVGMCVPEDAHIAYYSKQKRSEVVNTIIHELLHGVVYMFDINFRSLRDEERVVRKMANGLHTVLKDNPQFLEWIMQNANRDDE
jgi:hypothetical protein